MNPNNYPKGWNLIANDIKQKAGWKCQRCGAPKSQIAGQRLTVHHKDGDPQNCNESNLIALCQTCHLKEQIKLQPYLKRKALEDAGQLFFPL